MDTGLPASAAVVLLLLLGLSLGSFSSVLLTRTAPDDSLGGRSRCPQCRKPLGALELIPLASYLLQRGRCRGCGTRISPRYPLLELFGALAFGTAWLGTQGPLDALALGLVLWAAGMIVVSDLSAQSIPDLLTALLALGGLLLHRDALLAALLAALPGAVFLGGQWMLSRGRWVGSGDVLLAGALGFFVGRWEEMVVALAAAYIGGAVYAAGLLLVRGSEARRMHVPFAPFLIGGALIASLAGAQVAVAFGMNG